MVRDSAAQFAESTLRPRILDAYRNETVDRKVMTEMGGERASERLINSNTHALVRVQNSGCWDPSSKGASVRRGCESS
jgi:hypothetical protein